MHQSPVGYHFGTHFTSIPRTNHVKRYHFKVVYSLWVIFRENLRVLFARARAEIKPKGILMDIMNKIAKNA